MHALLVPVGSHGDVHPFIGLGHAIRRRGHRVTFLIGEYFAPLIRGLGFEMVGLGDAASFTRVMEDPDLWHPTRGFAVVARAVIEHARAVFGEIERLNVPGETAAVAGSLGFGVRAAHEAFGIPTATVHLQPGILHSDREPPAYSRVEIPRWLPTRIKHAVFDLVYSKVIDPSIAPGLDAFRAERGLPPLADPMRRGMHSTECVIALFPGWFGPPQPEWPPNLTQLGFPLYDEGDATPINAELERFLDDGTPPIAFTPGSANLHGRPFFEAAVDACARLGRRGLLLTRHPEQLPGPLPDGVRHVSYAPFGRLLPRVAALAHHGGIGTSSQGMAAGVPQLVMPLAHDQFDNAARMRRLGIARSLPPKRFRGPAVAEALRGLIGSPEVAANCRRVAGLVAGDGRPLDRAAEAVEGLLDAAAVPSR